MSLEFKDLVEGKIYTYESDNSYIFKYGKRKNGTIGYDYYINIGNSYYYKLNGDADNGRDLSKTRVATFEEEHWLNECIKLNKFIRKEEALKTFKYSNIKNEEFTVKKIKEILEGIYKDSELRKTCIPLFIGNPGLGKSVIIHNFAKEKGVNVVEMIGSTLMPHEISGICIPDQETKMMSYFDYDRLLSMKDGDILFLDELLNTNPMVLNAFLTLLTTRRMISGKKLPDIMIVAAANKQGASMLTPQIKERFIFYNVSFDPNMWANYMYEKYLVIDSVLADLITIIQNENFLTSETNYLSPRSIDKAIDMIIKGVETPYETKLLPILNKIVENTTGEDIPYGDGKVWKSNEKISWLKLKIKINE